MEDIVYFVQIGQAGIEFETCQLAAGSLKRD